MNYYHLDISVYPNEIQLKEDKEIRKIEEKNIDNLESNILKKIPSEWSDYETILPEPMDLTHLKLMKLLKYGKIALLNNPMALINKKKRNIKH